MYHFVNLNLGIMTNFHMNENISKRTFLSDFMMSIRKQNEISFITRIKIEKKKIF